MDIENAIVEFGTQGVLRYREISQRPDNELPEVFLGGFIASHLYDQFHCPVHIERLYLTLAMECGLGVTPELVNELGGLRADLVVYQSELSPAMIELKILDERTSPLLIDNDRLKMKKLACRTRVRPYVGVMICQTSHTLESTIARLQTVLDRPIRTGPPRRSLTGKWEWCFGCASLLDITDQGNG
ncbi:MAG: hypothetical protein HY271_00380 [Deltaproteobacteria bacterium]|nr:hypothetical protein [Deltaproteobacteria bacterium]